MSSVNKIILVVIIVALSLGLTTWKTGIFDNLFSIGDPKTILEFNKKQHSIDDPESTWVVVNKLRQLLPKNFIPSDLVQPDVALRRSSGSAEIKLRKSAAMAMEELFAEAEKANQALTFASGYRSFELQKVTYESEVEGFGQKIADKESARPGYSEHQTGWAADIGPASGKCVVLACFADTKEGKWVASNAHRFGFIVRYPKGSEDVVGYAYEPWHLRYVGKDLAAEINKTQLTLEEFFGLPPAPDYK